MGKIRDKERTRNLLVDEAFLQLWRYGYQAASIDRILANTGLTKGALYHHFKNKAELCTAAVRGPLKGWVLDTWVAPMEGARHPLEGFQEAIVSLLPNLPENLVQYGCPLNNLIHELPGVEDPLHHEVGQVMQGWRDKTKEEIERGQKRKSIRPDLNSTALATYILATVQGSLAIYKGFREVELIRTSLTGLNHYLGTLSYKQYRRKKTTI